MKVLAAVFLTIVVIAAIPIVSTYYFGRSPYQLSINSQVVTSPITQPSASNPLQDVTRKVPFTVTNSLNGSALASATLTIKDSSGRTLESLTTGSDGTATTGTAYRSGTDLILQISKTGYVTRYLSFKVPQMTHDDAFGTTLNYATTVSTIGLGDYVIKVTDSSGTSYTSAATTYNWTEKGTTSETFTVSVFETTDNEGWLDSYDVDNKEAWNLISMANFNVTSLSLKGAQSSVNWGGTMYYFNQVPQEQSYREKVGSSYPHTGVYTFTVQVSKGSFTGAGELDFDLRAYASTASFANSGDLGQNDASLATFALLFVT